MFTKLSSKVYINQKHVLIAVPSNKSGHYAWKLTNSAHCVSVLSVVCLRHYCY